VDYYVEARVRGEFSLQRKGLKVRFKDKEKSFEVQISQKLSSQRQRCGDFELMLSRRRAYTTVIGSELQANELIHNAVYFFAHLRLYDSRLEANMGVIDDFFKGPNYNGSRYLQNSIDFEELVFVPSKINRKNRVKLKLKGKDNKKVKLILGKTVDGDRWGVPTLHYELEAEGEGPLEDVAAVVCDFLYEVGFHPNHIETAEKEDATIFTQSLLNSYFDQE
jgi:hypothetical protein